MQKSHMYNVQKPVSDARVTVEKVHNKYGIGVQESSLKTSSSN